jgi:hypothetical protein
MQTPTLTRPKPTRGASRRPRPDDFRRLGLGPTEARVTVIRRAARQAASPWSAESDPAQIDQAESELALVLAATYRLLDPRRRDQLIERVQLLRAEPTPLRSHLLEQRSPASLAIGANTVESEESDEEQPLEMSEHDWMVESLAELRVEPPFWKRGANRVHEGHNRRGAKHDKHRAQMLEVARYLQTGNSKISGLTGILGGLGLLLLGVALIVGFSWLSGNDKAVQADPRSSALPELDLPAIQAPAAVKSPAKAATTELAPQAEPTEPPSDSQSMIDFEPVNPNYDSSLETMVPETAPSPTVADIVSAANIDIVANKVDTVADKVEADVSQSDLPGSQQDLPGVAEKMLEDLLSPPAVTPPAAIPVMLPDAVPNTVPEKVPAAIPANSESAAELAAPVRHRLPQQTEIDQAAGKLRNVAAGTNNGFPVGKSGVVETWQRANSAKAGSVDRVALAVLAGRQAVLIGEEALALAISNELSAQFSATPAAFGTMILRDAANEAVTLTEQERIVNWSLRITDQALVLDDYEAANEAARIGSGVAAKHGDPDLRARLKQRRESIVIAQRMAASISEQPLTSPKTADKAAAWNYGRHLALNQRNWKQALAWLAVGSDIRFAALASEELALERDSSAVSIAAVARRWHELAERRKGREQNSLRLHAHELLLRAAGRADVIDRLELEKEALAIEQQLPPDALPLDLTTARNELGLDSPDSLGNNSAPLVPNPNAPTTNPVAPLDQVTDPLSLGMLGRLVVSGQDTGVVLRLPTSIAVPRGAFNEVLGRTGVAPGPIFVEFHGYVQVPRDTTVRIVAAGPAANPAPLSPAPLNPAPLNPGGVPGGLKASGMDLVISLGQTGAPQSVPLQQNAVGYAAAIDLPAGIHRVTWKVSGDDFSTLQLLLVDDRNNEQLHLRHDQVTENLIRQLPVRLNIDFQAR